MTDGADAKQKSLAQIFRIPAPKEINTKKPVLIVEDQQDMRIIVASHLSKLGFQKVKQAGNGYEALELINTQQEKYSLIVSSIEMPVMGGFDLLQELRENPMLERPPFAVTMSNPNKERIMFALENGADGILVKPFSFNDILPKVHACFKQFHNPENPEKVYELAKAMFREDKFDEAAKVYDVISEHTTTAARPFVGLARIAEKKGDTKKALEYLDQAEQRNPNFVHLFAIRGQIKLAAGDSSGAIDCFKKAIELSPLNPIRYEEAAKPLFDEKRYEEGIEVLNIAIKNELSFPSLHHYLSQGYFSLKDFKKAIRHIRSALSEEQENVVYLNQLGICLKESDEVEEAMKTYNSVIKLDPGNRAALYNKAILMASQGDNAGAIKNLNRLLEKHPDFKPAAKKLAELGGESAA